MDPDGEVVERLGRVLAVEVPGGDDLPAVGEDDGVVGAAVHLGGDDVAHKVDGVVDDAVHLRSAAKGVSILDAVAEAVALCMRNGRKIFNGSTMLDIAVISLLLFPLLL